MTSAIHFQATKNNGETVTANVLRSFGCNNLYEGAAVTVYNLPPEWDVECPSGKCGIAIWDKDATRWQLVSVELP